MKERLNILKEFLNEVNTKVKINRKPLRYFYNCFFVITLELVEDKIISN